MSSLTEHNLLIFLLQFILLLGLSKLFGLLFARFKQSTITAEVLVGLILGPAIFGRYLPGFQGMLFPSDVIQISMLETCAWIGNFYLLMETGLDVNFGRIWKLRGQALTISVTDMIIPLLLALIPIYFFLPDVLLIDPSRRVVFSVFIATIMTISALPVAIRVMHDLNILKSDTGFLIISALTINDLLGWILFTIILGVFSQTQIQMLPVVKLVALTFAFTILSLTLMRNLVNKVMTVIHDRYGSDTGLKTTFVFLIGMLMGAFTSKIGIHSLFGFFIAGIIIGEAKHFSQNDRHVMNRLVHSIFVPVFFANIGLHLDLFHSFDWRIVLFFAVLGISVRYLGAYAGARFARQDKLNLNIIAICHTAGGEMHIVVAILALSSGLITQTIFIGIVFASILSTMVFGPWLAYAIKRKKLGLLNVLFNPDSIYLNTVYTDKTDLLSDMSRAIAHKTGLDESMILSEINLREEQMTTAMGKGIAFPHARLNGIDHPLIMFVRNTPGVEWDSPDGLPVTKIFIIITPKKNNTVQLHILQTLAKALSSKAISELLERADSPEIIWETLKPEIEACETCLV